MTFDDEDDATPGAADAPHPIEEEGKPVQPVQFEHSKQQTAMQCAETKAVLALGREVGRGHPRTWADLEAEAAAMDRANALRDALQSHILRHRRHAQRPDKASRYAGVTKGYGGTWKAAIRHKPSAIILPHLGTFNSQEQAATAFDLMALVLYGSEAVTNFPASRYERFLKSSSRLILKEAFAAEGRVARKEAREALAWLVRQVDQRGKATPGKLILSTA